MKISILDGYTLNPGDNPWTALETLGSTEIFERTDAAEVVSRAGASDILVINKVKLTSEVLQQLANLKFVAVTATGFDCVDVAVAKDRGIPVSNVPIYGTDSVAQYVMAMLLHIGHRIDLHDDLVREGEWARCGDFSFWRVPLFELTGKTIGIVGFGRIGRRIGHLANAFGMNVIAHSRSQDTSPDYAKFRWCSLDELAAESDVVSLSCPMTEATAGLVNSEFLTKMKRTAILINASRGGLVVESDLAAALNDGTIAAAGIDVASAEPIVDSNPLLSAKNCFITPHYAWATLEARRRLMQTTVDNVNAFIAGQPINVVNQ